MSTTVGGVRIVDMPDLGMFDATSSIVGERAGSGRFSAPALRKYFGSGTLNVMDFGAIGDGIADDTAAIQAALDAAAGKGTLLFPAGTYLYSFKLLVRSNSHLLIEAGATIMMKNGANSDCLVLPYDTVAGPTHNVLIELYGTLDGNYANNPTHGGGIVTDGAGPGIPNLCSNIYVQGNRQGLIHNFRNWGINITNCTNGEVSGITVDNCHSSTEFAANNGGISYNVGFSDCIVSNITDLGLVLYNGVVKGFIRNCEVFGCTSGGAFIFTDGNGVSNSDCEITGCELHDNGNYGCYIGGNVSTVNQTNSIISGNHIYANARAGVQFNQCDGVLFEGNYVHDNLAGTFFWPGSGVYGDVAVGNSSTRVSIVGNTILNPQAGRTDGKAYGIGIDSPDYLLISNNRISDNQATMSMTAAIGGVWGVNGLSEGNYYGRRINAAGYFPADLSFYTLASRIGVNYDTITGATSGLVTSQVAAVFVDGSFPSQAITGVVPGRGLSVGWNKDLSPTHHSGLGEVDLFVGDGAGQPGGFNIFQVQAIRVTAGTYDAPSGAVSLTTNIPHSLVAGNAFKLTAATGTFTSVSTDIVKLNGPGTATAGTGASTLNFTDQTGLDILTITGGAIVVSGDIEAGVVNTAVGVSGSLLANDGYGNTRLGGALVHGAMQTAAGVVNGGTVTVNPGTSMVLIRNATSIAAASVILPAPLNFQYSAGAELEVNFQSPIGALTVTAATGATVINPPTTVAAGGTSVNFVNTGTTWLRRIMA